MKNKKKLLIAGASAASLAALGFGAFAFFTDTVELTKNTKVGTVELSVDAEIKHTQLTRSNALKYPYDIYDSFTLPFSPDWEAEMPRMMAPKITKSDLEAMFEEAPDNLNPGDNMGNNSDEVLYPGTDHEIIVNITNEGSKSVQTRIVFEVSGTDSEGEPLTNNDLRHIKLFFDALNSVSGLTSAQDVSFNPSIIFTSRDKLPEASSPDNNTIVYVFDHNAYFSKDRSQTEFGEVFLNEQSDFLNSRLTLSGNPKHDNVETEKAYKEYVVETTDEYGDPTGYKLLNEIITVPYSGTVKFDIGLDSPYNRNGSFNEETFETLQKLQNADIQIKVIVQGIQLRNSDPDMWHTLFEQSFLV